MGSYGRAGCFDYFADSRAGALACFKVLPEADLLGQAVQIFEVLRSIGGYHSFSAGLVIGGKNLKEERDRLSKMNILVATPGRLLQHMDQTVGFESDNLKLLGMFITLRCTLFLLNFVF